MPTSWWTWLAIPYASLEGTVDLSPSEVARHMQERLSEVPPARLFPPISKEIWRYVGRVDDGGFDVSAAPRDGQGYLPTFRGEFLAENGATRVHGAVAARWTDVGVLAAIGTMAVVSGTGGIGDVIWLSVLGAFHVFWYMVVFRTHQSAFEVWLTGLPGWRVGRRTRDCS
jgi:hypothetical protein